MTNTIFMKKLLIFLLFLPVLGCNNIIKDNKTTSNFNCPIVFFSSLDKIYIDNSNSLDEVSLKAELNNFAFNKNCKLQDNLVTIPLDILIVAKPMNDLENIMLNFPIYVSLLDENDNLLETQYFLISDSMEIDPKTKKLIESDIANQIKIITDNLNTSQLILGFMIDNKKRNLLN